MDTLTYSMNRWTTEDIMSELVRRIATDVPALRFVDGVILRARLAAGDRLHAESESPLGASIASAGVRGTTEISLADDAGRAGSRTAPAS